MAKANEKATAKAKVNEKPAAKKVETHVGETFSTESWARAISEKSVVDGKATISITQAGEIIGFAKEAIADALKEGKKVQITGFLTISPSYREEREGNNVFTGEAMTIPAAVTFNAKVGKGLKDIAKELPAPVVAAIKKMKEK